MHKMQALSPVGRCKTFDSSADGYGRGEGFAVIMLAQRPAADVYGVAGASQSLAILRGSAVNSAGKSSGLTAPSGPAQQKLVTLALTSGNLSAADVVYLATHGTGTPLGDPIGRHFCMQMLPAKRVQGTAASYMTHALKCLRRLR